MRRTALLCLVVLLAVPSSAGALSTTAVQSKLRREMGLVGARGGAYVLDLDADAPIFAARPDTARPPASVEKLYTTSTALLRFGADGTLQTQLLTDADVDPDGVLRGDLWLRGAGDPTLTSTRLAEMGDQLAYQNVRSVTGGLAGDASVFDRLPGTYRTGGRFDWEMGGALAGLSLNRGLAGGRPQSAPALNAARSLSGSLRKAGVRVRGKTTSGAAPAGAKVLATTASPPMRQIVAATLVPSDNWYAETLLKTLGAHFGGAGSTAAGAKVVRDQLAGFGVRAQVADGSGLSRANRTSPRQVVRLLQQVSRTEVAEAFRSAMPLAGRTGTLRRRMRGTPAAGRCSAKTGTLNAVSALAGYCPTRDGHTVAFAFLMSNTNVAGARRIQDRMTAAIASLDTGG